MMNSNLVKAVKTHCEASTEQRNSWSTGRTNSEIFYLEWLDLESQQPVSLFRHEDWPSQYFERHLVGIFALHFSSGSYIRIPW